ncbi:hypothetical protein [Marinoscillum sp.]|uniref:hypothetical protein n=1 Tax=Marinoscillum sp. TaxID=2024838 RepID=UPI003BAD8B59
MMVIADAGGSKTDWRLIDNGRVLQYVSGGFNAQTHSLKQLTASLPSEINWSKVNQVHYYAAGISDSTGSSVKELLQKHTVQSNVFVYPDTLGVARGLLGADAGWVGILGTGSAAFYYDGKTISIRKPSLGYLLGDEGSGVALGKELVQRYVRGFLSKELQHVIERTFPGISEAQMLDEVYQNGNMKTYLSQFVPFLVDNQSHPEIHQLVAYCFERYFEAYFENKSPETIAFSGSVGFLLGNILQKVARSRAISIQRTVQSPIAGLTLYHQRL